MFEKIFENLSKTKPIVHCITNFVTVNDCANMILACGGSPTMAHHKDEVEDITSKSQSLVLNMGTLFDLDSMIIAGKKSNQLHHPVVLDPVGMGASALRNKTFETLSKEIHFSVIRGNISEIKRIATGKGTTRGVDASEMDQITEDNVGDLCAMAKTLSTKLNSVIAISGAMDIVADSQKAYIVRNGHPTMAKITGSGCMLTALIGAFCGANSNHILKATLGAVASMGICGELAYEKIQKLQGGTMSFRMYLIDFMSNITVETINERIKLEEQ